ncbi:SUF system Fe-S cluster assembly protein [bacterium]|nr:SUF system Fe-S cluster assembly protein [bacterium]
MHDLQIKPLDETTLNTIKTAEGTGLHDKVVAILKTVYDPEIPVNIWELGLIYRAEVLEDGKVEIDMTLTAPACPVAGTMPGEVQTRILQIPGVKDVNVELVWEPAWTQDRMTDEARLELGLF